MFSDAVDEASAALVAANLMAVVSDELVVASAATDALARIAVDSAPVASDVPATAVPA